MGVPQIIVVVLMVADVISGAFFHGKERSNYNFFSILISTGIMYLLLSLGGFFE